MSYSAAELLEAAKKALSEAGYDTHERSPGPGVYIADPAPDSSEYADGTVPGGAWDEECDDLLAEIRAIVEPCECTADWDDDDIVVEAMPPCPTRFRRPDPRIGAGVGGSFR